MGVFEQFPYSNFHDLNIDWVLGKLKEWQAKIDEFAATLESLKLYEKSADITYKRKLSPTGDFTGSISGRSTSAVLGKLDGTAQQLQYLTSQFSDGQTGLVINGGYFDSTGISKVYRGGFF